LEVNLPIHAPDDPAGFSGTVQKPIIGLVAGEPGGSSEAKVETVVDVPQPPILMPGGQSTAKAQVLPPPPTVRITSPNQATFRFVATNVNGIDVPVPAGVKEQRGPVYGQPIQITATTQGPVSGNQVQWLIVGLDLDNATSGSPTPNPATGLQMSFTPNPTHPNYDATRNSGGRREPAPGFAYTIQASIPGGAQHTITLQQHAFIEIKDIVIQEYVNHATVTSGGRNYPATRIPTQLDIGSVKTTSRFGPPSDSINGGNYNDLIVNGVMIDLAEQIRVEYNNMIDDDPSTDYGIRITSGYRNPERNENVGGAIASFHQDGSAIDLAPVFNVPNMTASQLWCTLLNAAQVVARRYPSAEAQAEDMGRPVPCNASPDHIHVEVEIR
jgi:hypothetical protein